VVRSKFTPPSVDSAVRLLQRATAQLTHPTPYLEIELLTLTEKARCVPSLDSARTTAKQPGLLEIWLLVETGCCYHTPLWNWRNSGSGCPIRGNSSPAILLKNEMEMRLGRFVAPTSIPTKFSYCRRAPCRFSLHHHVFSPAARKVDTVNCQLSL